MRKGNQVPSSRSQTHQRQNPGSLLCSPECSAVTPYEAPFQGLDSCSPDSPPALGRALLLLSSPQAHCLGSPGLWPSHPSCLPWKTYRLPSFTTTYMLKTANFCPPVHLSTCLARPLCSEPLCSDPSGTRLPMTYCNTSYSQVQN